MVLILQLKIAVCDDEKIICEDIQKKLINIKSDYLIDSFNTSNDILLNALKYDIIFLDIEMPEIDGLSIAKELRQRSYKGYIVFLSSHTEFVMEAFKVKAFRFLEKPIDINMLNEAISEAEKEIYENKHIIVKGYGTEILIDISEILYIKADGNKTLIVSKEKVIETNETLKQWIEELGDENFCQIHRAYIVSLKHVKEINYDRITLDYSNIEIPVSRRRLAKFKMNFYSYIGQNAKIM